MCANRVQYLTCNETAVLTIVSLAKFFFRSGFNENNNQLLNGSYFNLHVLLGITNKVSPPEYEVKVGELSRLQIRFE